MLKGFEEDLAGLDLPDEAKQALIEAANKRASGLMSKNTELLDKLASTKNVANENQSAVEKLAALEALQQQKALEDKQNYEEALALHSDKYSKQINELTEKVGLFEQKERNMVIGAGISDALTEAHVNPLHADLVSTYFKQQAQLVDGKVTIGDKTLSEAIKEWSETDQGKAVRLAPENTRGDSRGTTQVSGSGKNMSESEQRAYDINKRFGR